MESGKPYPVPAIEIRRELIVVNSRFVATLAPVFSVEEAKAFIARVKNELLGASHHVPVYLIGHGDTLIAHCSDAGEPSGTAGRPALAVLQGSGLGDVAVVISRYFGGTLLGTGGLVRAYSESVRMVVKDVPRAMKILTHTVMLGCHYRYLERIRLLVEACHGQTLAEDFSAEVTLTIRLAVENLQPFKDSLRELSNGVLQVEIIETGKFLQPIRNE